MLFRSHQEIKDILDIDVKILLNIYNKIELIINIEAPFFGVHGEEETPVLIPNTEVKLPSGDYTAKVGN